MPVRTSLAAIVVAVACLTGVAYAGGPGDVYKDFAQDGKLSCNHSRANLLAVLRSGSIDQYGDPYTLARLKLAIRRQVAGGCRRHSGSSGGKVQSSGERSTATETTSKAGRSGNAHRRLHQRTDVRHPQAAVRGGSSSQSAASAMSDGGNSGFISGRVLLAGLVVGVVAIGGWLTRRALAAGN
jgi:hypothetical protein